MEQDFALCGVAVDDLSLSALTCRMDIDDHFHDHHVEVVVAEDARERLPAYGAATLNNDALCAFGVGKLVLHRGGGARCLWIPANGPPR